MIVSIEIQWIAYAAWTNIEPVFTSFGGLLGSSAEEGRAKPRNYSV
jgi:hypothetical protein